ncbi:MAG: HTTM domain-containing protein [Deltaproteobacteria bacterium]
MNPPLRAVSAIERVWAAAHGYLFAPIDIASIVYYRIAFGLLMFFNMAGTLIFDMDAWANPGFRFHYPGLEWVKPLPGGGMHAIFAALSILGLCIAAGLKYRTSAMLFALLFTYVFLTERAKYLNHYYLILLIGLLMAFIPANRQLSIDAMINPRIRSEVACAWNLLALRFQIAVVYFYAGVAKINGDWLAGEPMGLWLGRRDFLILDEFLKSEAGAYLFSYGGLGFDLLAAPLLVWRRARTSAFMASLIFHILNSLIFNIGIFPLLAAASTALFFTPSFPRNIIGIRKPEIRLDKKIQMGMTQLIVVSFISIYVAAQLCLPLRHFLYAGDVNWTGEGHEFSWRMKTLDRRAEITFLVKHRASGREWTISPEQSLTPFQYRKMAARPELILQFAANLSEEFKRKGYPDAEVFAISFASVNGRKMSPMVNPEVNLAIVSSSAPVSSWTLPLGEPLRPEESR